jgi:hypothetical protein
MTLDMNEIWKPAYGSEGIYEISNLGNFRSKEHIGRHGQMLPGKILKVTYDTQGYPGVSLCIDGVYRRKMLYALMLSTFVRPPVKGEVGTIVDLDQPITLDNLTWRLGRTCPKDYCKRGHRLRMPKGNQTRRYCPYCRSITRQALRAKRKKELEHASTPPLQTSQS